jgi:hypothetical protein
MKNHKRFEELIQGYVDNVLSDKERQDFEEHLKSCKMCEEKLKIREKLLEKLRSGKEEIQCPDKLIDNILKRTSQKEAPTIISSTIIRWKYLAVSAAAAVVIFSTVLLNLENNEQLLTPIEIKEPRGKGFPAEVEISKSKEISLDKEKVKSIKAEESDISLRSEKPSAPKASLPEKKADFATAEKLKGDTFSADITEFVEDEELQEKTLMLSKAAKSPPSTAIKRDRIKEIPAFKTKKDIEIESISPKALEYGILGEGISMSVTEETRFVFPEEGSVVGKDFEIVLILENPKEKIEITLDGEKIVDYTIEEDSNIIFIGSDSLPPLEAGLHYISLTTKEEKSITFYKEG